GTDTRKAVTTAGEHEFTLHYVEDTAADNDESSYFRPNSRPLCDATKILIHTRDRQRPMGVIERVSQSRLVLSGVGAFGVASFVGMFALTEPIMYGANTPVNYISYWHIALAWTSGVALLVTFGASIQYLRTRTRYWNLVAHGSGEVGFVFLTGTLVMGSIWASEMWGTYWSWADVRLVTLFVTWLVYLGYLLVFQSTRGTEDRYAAVYGAVGFVTIPVSYLSTRLWNPTFHAPTIGGSTGETILDPVTLLFAIAAAMLLFGVLASLRIRVHHARDTLVRMGEGR
ncbi:MAG: heme exporter protein C, partial [Natrialbaceae archaeon]